MTADTVYGVFVSCVGGECFGEDVVVVVGGGLGGVSEAGGFVFKVGGGMGEGGGRIFGRVF